MTDAHSRIATQIAANERMEAMAAALAAALARIAVLEGR